MKTRSPKKTKDPSAPLVVDKPRCTKCNTCVGWTRLIRQMSRNKPAECEVCELFRG
jgi:hypothetical protein